jgi:hypothetical protein
MSTAPEYLLDVTSPTIDETARRLAAAIAGAVEGDGDGPVLIGPMKPILDDGRTLGLTLMIATHVAGLLAVQVVPKFDIDIGTAAARTAFRHAIVEALRRHCVVESFDSVRELIIAARSPAAQREALPLLH